MTLHQWIKEASDAGLDGFDLSVLFFRKHPDEQISACRKAAEAEGISPVLFNTYSDLAHPSADVREKEVQQLCDDIAAAGEVKAKYVRLVAGQGYPETGIDEGVQWVVQGFLRAQDAARQAGVELVYENHSKPGIWQYADFSLRSEVYLRIADALKGSAVRLLFDTANPIAAGEDPIELLERIAEEVVCVHAADTRTSGALNPVVIGTGLVPFSRLFSFLKQRGFSGWISLEEASGTGRDGIISGTAYVKEVWESCWKR